MKNQARSKNVPLLAAMASVGETGQSLARKCGVHRVTISAILNNRVEPKPSTAKAIADALSVPAEALFGEEVAQ